MLYYNSDYCDDDNHPCQARHKEDPAIYETSPEGDFRRGNRKTHRRLEWTEKEKTKVVNPTDYEPSVMDWRGFKPLSSLSGGFEHDPSDKRSRQGIFQSQETIWLWEGQRDHKFLESLPHWQSGFSRWSTSLLFGVRRMIAVTGVSKAFPFTLQFSVRRVIQSNRAHRSFLTAIFLIPEFIFLFYAYSE